MTACDEDRTYYPEGRQYLLQPAQRHGNLTLLTCSGRVIISLPSKRRLIRKSSLLVLKPGRNSRKDTRPGIKTITLNKLAETFIRDNGGGCRHFFAPHYSGFPIRLHFAERTGGRMVSEPV